MNLSEIHITSCAGFVSQINNRVYSLKSKTSTGFNFECQRASYCSLWIPWGVASRWGLKSKKANNRNIVVLFVKLVMSDTFFFLEFVHWFFDLVFLFLSVVFLIPRRFPLVVFIQQFPNESIGKLLQKKKIIIIILENIFGWQEKLGFFKFMMISVANFISINLDTWKQCC